jgi:hypothetical protein
MGPSGKMFVKSYTIDGKTVRFEPPKTNLIQPFEGPSQEDINDYGLEFATALGGKANLGATGVKYSILAAEIESKYKAFTDANLDLQLMKRRMAVTSIMFLTKPMSFIMRGVTKTQEKEGKTIGQTLSDEMIPYCIIHTDEYIEQFKKDPNYIIMQNERLKWPEAYRNLNVSAMRLMAFCFAEYSNGIRQAESFRMMHAVDGVPKKPTEVEEDNPRFAALSKVKLPNTRGYGFTDSPFEITVKPFRQFRKDQGFHKTMSSLFN